MKRFAVLAAWVLIPIAAGIGLGIWSARATIAWLPERSMIRLGPWTFSPQTGGSDASMHLRAVIAVRATLALASTETIYFFARHDSDGEPLRARCHYQIEGHAPEARWWSLTLYGADQFLIPEPDKRFSYSGSWTGSAPGRPYSIALGPLTDGAAGLSTKGAAPAGTVGLTLRLYRPGASIAADPVSAPLPTIRQTQPCV